MMVSCMVSIYRRIPKAMNVSNVDGDVVEDEEGRDVGGGERHEQ